MDSYSWTTSEWVTVYGWNTVSVYKSYPPRLALNVNFPHYQLTHQKGQSLHNLSGVHSGTINVNFELNGIERNQGLDIKHRISYNWMGRTYVHDIIIWNSKFGQLYLYKINIKYPIHFESWHSTQRDGFWTNIKNFSPLRNKTCRKFWRTGFTRINNDDNSRQDLTDIKDDTNICKPRFHLDER